MSEEHAWIPVWEDLPPDDGQVLVKLVLSGEHQEFEHAVGRFIGEDDSSHGHWVVADWPKATRVVAWAPLPAKTRGQP